MAVSWVEPRVVLTVFVENLLGKLGGYGPLYCETLSRGGLNVHIICLPLEPGALDKAGLVKHVGQRSSDIYPCWRWLSCARTVEVVAGPGFLHGNAEERVVMIDIQLENSRLDLVVG